MTTDTRTYTDDEMRPAIAEEARRAALRDLAIEMDDADRHEWLFPSN